MTIYRWSEIRYVWNSLAINFRCKAYNQVLKKKYENPFSKNECAQTHGPYQSELIREINESDFAAPTSGEVESDSIRPTKRCKSSIDMLHLIAEDPHTCAYYGMCQISKDLSLVVVNQIFVNEVFCFNFKDHFYRICEIEASVDVCFARRFLVPILNGGIIWLLFAHPILWQTFFGDSDSSCCIMGARTASFFIYRRRKRFPRFVWKIYNAHDFFIRLPSLSKRWWKT